jgi:anti-sigma-K factor RskA
MGELNRDELRDLLGAYALDAVDPDERDDIERQLAADPAARAEVAEFRELAAALANIGNDAPVGVWDRISEAIEGEGRPPVTPIVPPSDMERRRQSRGLRVAASAAALAAAAAVVLGVRVGQQEHRINNLSGAIDQMEKNPLGRELAAAKGRVDAHTVSLADPAGRSVAQVVFLPDGTGYFADRSLGALPAGRVYQLWALVGDAKNPTAVSAGVLGSAPNLAAFTYNGQVVGFAVTDEAAPGVVSSTQKPVGVGNVA